MRLRAIIERHKKATALDRYIEKHGWHFTAELAEVVAGTMGEDAKLTNEQKTWIKGTGYTEGDLIYLRAMYTSDFPSLNLEVLCKNTLLDADGYDGMIFKRWLTDVKGRSQDFDWEDFL